MQAIKQIGALLTLLGIGVYGAGVIHALPERAYAVIMLAPAIAEADSPARLERIFFTNTLVITSSAQKAWLASTSDGTGDLCTDDQVSITINHPERTQVIWTHRYASADRQQIRCLEAQEIVLPGSAAPYTLTITLEDMYPPKYSSQPYFLLLERAPAGKTPLPHIATAAGVVPTARHDSPSEVVRTVPQPSTTAAVTPTASLNRLPLLQHTRDTESLWPLPGWMVAAAAGIGLLILLLLIRRMQHGRREPQLRGIVDLIDQETGEIRTVLLTSYAYGAAIVRQPLALLPWTKRDSVQNVLATLIPAAQGPVLTIFQHGVEEQSQYVRVGERIQVAQMVELRYRM